MGKNERQAYLKAIRSRYRRAGKKGKGIILNEFCAVCGYNRKYTIRLLNQCGKPRTRRRPGRKPIYASAELLTALKRIWFARKSHPEISRKKRVFGRSLRMDTKAVYRISKTARQLRFQSLLIRCSWILVYQVLNIFL